MIDGQCLGLICMAASQSGAIYIRVAPRDHLMASSSHIWTQYNTVYLKLVSSCLLACIVARVHWKSSGTKLKHNRMPNWDWYKRNRMPKLVGTIPNCMPLLGVTKQNSYIEKCKAKSITNFSARKAIHRQVQRRTSVGRIWLRPLWYPTIISSFRTIIKKLAFIYELARSTLCN